jgi:Secretion system C-terminal sorting domain
MKTFVPLKQILVKLMLLVSISLFFNQATSAQALSFKSPVLESGTDLQKGAEYRFSAVAAGIDAIVKIEDLINGAEVKEIDQTGVGYNAAFQPLVYTPGGTRTSYALFSVTFVKAGTNSNTTLGDFSATSLDLDGNSTLKEFSEITMTGGGCALNYLTSTLQIAVATVSNGYKGVNTTGVEYAGIDTSALTAMYTVKRTNVSGFDLEFGAVTTGAAATSRQYSLYMKDFSYELKALPVTLVSFSAMLENKKADLTWTTATEINVSHFVVEKSTDGKNFNDAGMVFAYGNTTENVNYSFADNVDTDQAGVIYYRLRSVDVDGQFTYSTTRIIRISKIAENSISIVTYPNPVSNELRVTIPANWQNKKVTYEMFNGNGQVSKKSETASSSQTETLNVSTMPPGFYIVRVTCDGQIAQQKILKS